MARKKRAHRTPEPRVENSAAKRSPKPPCEERPHSSGDGGRQAKTPQECFWDAFDLEDEVAAAEPEHGDFWPETDEEEL